MDLFDDSKLYTVKQVAEPLEEHENFVWREIRKGHLRAVKLTAKFIRLRGQDVNEWLERGVTTPAAKEPDHSKELQDA
jgi:excisionase family DNA binding protein